jgi:hypothetical protein
VLISAITLGTVARRAEPIYLCSKTSPESSDSDFSTKPWRSLAFAVLSMAEAGELAVARHN